METITTRTQLLSFNQKSIPNDYLSKAGMEGPCYSIRLIKEKDHNRVLSFLHRLFFKDEPLNVCVGLLDEPGSSCEELEQYCMGSMEEGVSLMAVSPSDKILGVCLNGISSREDSALQELKDEEVDKCANKKFQKILRLLNTVSKDSNLFGQFPDIDRALELRVISVDEACRGQGIAKALMERCRTLAKELSIPLIRVDCTSHFSAMAVSRLGYHCIYTLQYAEHLDQEGTPVFIPEPPHSCVKTYVMPIS